MEDKLWKVYVHINKENGKRYIGITSKPKAERRWRGGQGYDKNPRFMSAIKHYGWDGFEHIILEDSLTENEAKNMEIDLIAKWHTTDKDYGYNMTTGGDGSAGYHPSDETRAKLSAARRRENLSDETLKRRSDGLRGRKFSDEHKRKIGAGNSKAINMIAIDGKLIKTFISAADAESETGIAHSHISQCCNGKRHTTGGYMWKFAQ